MQKETKTMEKQIVIEKKSQFQEKERQYQLKMKETEMQDKRKSAHLPLDPTKQFDFTKHIRFVLPFKKKKLTNIS